LAHERVNLWKQREAKSQPKANIAMATGIAKWVNRSCGYFFALIIARTTGQPLITLSEEQVWVLGRDND